jgi:hypothetical protein
MVQDIITKADSHSACQKNPALFTEPEGPLPCSQKLTKSVTLRNRLFYTVRSF